MVRIRIEIHYKFGNRSWDFNFLFPQVDLAEAVGADLKVMERDAARMRLAFLHFPPFFHSYIWPSQVSPII